MNRLLPLVLIALISGPAAHAQGDKGRGTMEEETPAGQVPPQQGAPRADGLAGETGMMAQPEAEAGVDIDAVIRAFASAYAGQDSPRMIVYFNRELSDEVREWTSTERLAIDGQRRSTESGPEGETRRTDRGGVSIAAQVATDDGGRFGPGERWMWEFEQAISEMMLDADVALIDRALVMRRQAAATDDDTLGNPSRSVRTIEMQALEGYADLLVEVWVARSPESPVGYEFRAQVKDVDDGRLVATVTTFGEGLPMAGGRQSVVATSRGYEIVEEVPTVTDAATELGVAVMESLGRRWR